MPLIDFGKRDYRNVLVSTEMRQFIPFSTLHETDHRAARCPPSGTGTDTVEVETARKTFTDLKHIIFTRTKLSALWVPALRETTTATGAPPDEYERPDDLKEICINRIEANSAKAAALGTAAGLPSRDAEETSVAGERGGEGEAAEGSVSGSRGSVAEMQLSVHTFEEKLRMSVFGQIMEGIKHWDDRSLRRSFAHMQDAGQARAFFVKFTGEI